MKLAKYKIKFLDEVIEEINHIKSKATKEEIERLDFSMFNYENRLSCIYDQM